MLRKCKSIFVALTMLLTLGTISSCGKNSGKNIEIAGVKGPNVSLLEDSLLVSIVFENTQIDGGLRYNIPKYKYSYLEVSPDLQSNGTLMTISVSLQDLMNGGLDKLDPQKLPGGRNLPGVASGALPAVAFSIEKFHNMSFYLGKDIFGIFVPAQVGVDGAIASFRYYVGSKAAGTISLIGNDQNGENAGILLMLNVTSQAKAMMKQIEKKYH